MGYDKGKAAESLGIDRRELEARADRAGFDSTEAYYNFIGGANAPMIEQIEKQIIELDRELDKLGPLGLTDQEKQNFLEKAISQIQPYYDRKTAEIEAGVREGSLRSAEDVLLYMRDVENDIKTELSSLDLRNAETEEEFLNIITDITSSRDENIETKREDWRLRLEDTKMSQIRSGIFSSGIGKKKRDDMERLKEMEIGQTEARAERDITQAETARKYDIQQIRLAREAAERDRVSKIGAPTQAELTAQKNLGTLGLSDMSELGSRADIETSRATDARNISTYRPEALTGLEEERRKAVESRKQELQSEELTLRDQEYEKQRQKILADKAAAQSRIARYR